eukprot:Pgem_evm1s19087
MRLLMECIKQSELERQSMNVHLKFTGIGLSEVLNNAVTDGTYKTIKIRKAIDECAFKFYGHWIKQNNAQNQLEKQLMNAHLKFKGIGLSKVMHKTAPHYSKITSLEFCEKKLKKKRVFILILNNVVSDGMYKTIIIELKKQLMDAHLKFTGIGLCKVLHNAVTDEMYKTIRIRKAIECAFQ